MRPGDGTSTTRTTAAAPIVVTSSPAVAASADIGLRRVHAPASLSAHRERRYQRLASLALTSCGMGERASGAREGARPALGISAIIRGGATTRGRRRVDARARESLRPTRPRRVRIGAAHSGGSTREEQVHSRSAPSRGRRPGDRRVGDAMNHRDHPPTIDRSTPERCSAPDSRALAHRGVGARASEPVLERGPPCPYVERAPPRSYEEARASAGRYRMLRVVAVWSAGLRARRRAKHGPAPRRRLCILR